MYAMLRSAVVKAEAEVSADRTCFSIMSGDWNAALLEGYRLILTSDGSARQGLIAGLAMTPTQQRTELARPATHQQAENVPSCRTGDVLMSQGLVPCQSPLAQMVSGTCDGDCSALLAKVPLGNRLQLGPGPDVAELPAVSKLKTPVPAHQVAAFNKALAMEIGEEIAELNAELEKTVRRAHDIKADNPKV